MGEISLYPYGYPTNKGRSFSELITSIWSSSPLLVVKIIHLVDKTDLFIIGNLVYGGREVVTSLYSSFTGTGTVYGEYSELACSLFVSVKIDGLGNFLEKLTL